MRPTTALRSFLVTKQKSPQRLHFLIDSPAWASQIALKGLLFNVIMRSLIFSKFLFLLPEYIRYVTSTPNACETLCWKRAQLAMIRMELVSIKSAPRNQSVLLDGDCHRVGNCIRSISVIMNPAR